MNLQPHQPYYLKKLRDEYAVRMARRPEYSLRAFAKFLGLEAPSLSGILKGNRRVAKSKVAQVADKLNLSPEEKNLFIQSNSKITKETQATSKIDHQYQLDPETHFKIIAEWEHYAILSLMETADFKPQTNWIAERLGISDLRAKICLDHLIEAGLICVKDQSFVLTQASLKTTEDIPSQALRKARKQDLEMAMSSIDEISVELRDLSSCTMTMNLEDMQEMKMMIRDFRKRCMARAESHKGHEVYKLAIQLYPLTKVRRSHEST